MKNYQFKNLDPKRSSNMRAIKSKNTAIEIILRKALFAKGLRYRIHYKNLPGTPDIVFVKKKWLFFVIVNSGTVKIGLQKKRR